MDIFFTPSFFWVVVMVNELRTIDGGDVMRTQRILWCVVAIVMGLAGCSAFDTETGFTGTFRLIEYPEQGQYRVQVFVLTQEGDQITGTYTQGETLADSQWDCVYDVTGTVILPDSAKLDLILASVNPPDSTACESEPTLTLNVMLKNNGDLLYVSEWDIELPRVAE